MRRVHADIQVHLVITADEGIEISAVIQEMEYNFSSNTAGAFIEDSSIEDMTITDSR